MTGDCHVRFCERLRGETPLCLLGVASSPHFAVKIQRVLQFQLRLSVTPLA